jgi:ParB family chromosome partitioning protein
MNAARSTDTPSVALPIDALRESPTNPRQQFDPVALTELAASIRSAGILQPLLVRPIYLQETETEDEFTGYEIIAGSRRFRAAKIAELAEVPCIVRTLTDDEARNAQIIENLQRADVHPVEEAEGYRALIADAAAAGGNLSAEDIARRVGKEAKHVAKLLKLLTLEIDAKLLFSRGHITLAHALMLAVLTPADQERALRFMFDSDPKLDKRSMTEIIRARLRSRGEKVEEDAAAEPEDGDNDGDGFSASSYGDTSQKAKYMHHGRRLIDATEAQLRRWIESNVLLKLVNAPFGLMDAELVPIAGACVDCPKRSGSNAALFSDFTAEEDVCLDPACYAAKQKAYISWEQATAKKQGRPLARLSSKRGQEKLPENWNRERLLLKAGQWVAAAAGSCPKTFAGLMRDGAEAGKVFTICADQKCKVHKHSVDSPRSANHYGAPPQTPDQVAEAQAKQAFYVDSESKVRVAVLAAVVAKAILKKEAILRALVLQAFNAGWNMNSILVADALGIVFERLADPSAADRAASNALENAIATADELNLLRMAVAIGHAEPFDIGRVEGAQAERKEIAKLAKVYGIDSEALAAKALGSPKKAAKPPAKKVVAKKVAAPAAKKKLSPEARKRIADALTKRIAARRKAVKK